MITEVLKFTGTNEKINGYDFNRPEGSIVIKPGDSPLTVERALMLLERCSIQIKRQAGWL